MGTWIPLQIPLWKLLGFFLLLRLQQDWKAAESNPEILNNAE